MSTDNHPSASQIAAFLGLPLHGSDVAITRVVPLAQLQDNCLGFARDFRPDFLEIINQHPASLVICSPPYAGKVRASHLLVGNPRLAFLRAVQEFFYSAPPAAIHPTAVVDPTARLGREVSLGPGTVVGAGARLGDRTRLGSNVVIAPGVVIGADCVIKSNTVIGEDGFGYELNDLGQPERFPHIGTVVIEDNVHIGACSTVEKGTIDKTLICQNVKIDDLVQIGHNTVTGPNTLVMAGTIICGGAVVGRNCWLAPNTTLKDGVRMGDFSQTGLGAVVINDVPERVVVIGVPARLLRDKL